MKPNVLGFVSKYMEEMADEGIAETRVTDLWNALYELHLAISKLDLSNARKFWEKTIEDRLEEFAEAEKMRDVVPEMPELAEGEFLDDERIIARTLHLLDVKRPAKAIAGVTLTDREARQLLKDLVRELQQEAELMPDRFIDNFIELELGE